MAGLLGCRRGWFFFLVGHRRDHHLADDFFSSPSWCDNLQATTGYCIGLPLLAITSKAAMTEPEPIDLEYYRKGLRSHIVDSYKDYYDSMYTDSVEPAAAPMAASPFPAESRHKKPDIDQFAPEKATKNSAAAVEKGHNGGMGSRNVGIAADWRPKAEWKLVEGQYGLSISWKWMQKWRMSVAFLIVQLLEMHYGSVMRKSDYEGGMMLQILTIAETGYGISIGKHEQNLL
ncbi:hypothetical protein LXL04_023579 [Taraxacum kok-saghyz]